MRGAGGPSGGNSIQQMLGSGTLTCRPRDLKGVQHDTDPLPTQGVVVTSLTHVGKRGNPSREFRAKLRNHQPECQQVEGKSGYPGDTLPVDRLEI